MPAFPNAHRLAIPRIHPAISRLSPATATRIAVGIGLALRLLHFLRNPAVWHDEAAFLVNVLHLPFAKMLGPLLHNEAAPPLFLAAERAVMLAFGDSLFSLRLLPFLAACASVPLLAGVAVRVLSPWPAAVATGLFAVSDRLLWHACEAKPYSVDVFVAALVAYGFVRTAEWRLANRGWLGALVAPACIWISFPACFVFGGVLLGLLPAAWRSRRSIRDLLGYAAFGLAVCGAFAAFAMGPAVAQRSGPMEDCWTGHFPDWSKPAFVPVWIVLSVLEVGRYCLMPLGQVLTLIAGVGAVSLARRGYGEFLVVILAPVGLALVAALLHKYPFGGSRLEAFAAPCLCLLVAEGAAKLARRGPIATFLVVALLLMPAGLTAVRAVAPWPRAACDRASEHVLAYYRPGDRILENHWEYDYYFRHLPPETRRSWLGAFEPGDLVGGRIWVIHTAGAPPTTFPFPLPERWKVAERVVLPMTTVFLLTAE